MALNDFNFFGNSTTYNPYANNVDLKLLDNITFQIPTTANFTGRPAISVAIGLVPSLQSFTADTFIAEIIDTNNNILQLLKTKVGVVGSNEYPQVNEIIWFDEVGMQGEYWVHESWKGKILRLNGKFETASITAEFLNNLKKNLANVGNVIKTSPPPIAATYTQWNLIAPTPQSKWPGTQWTVVSTKKVFIKESTFTSPVQNATHWLDNNTTAIECDCIGGGGGGGGNGAYGGAGAGANGGNSSINYNGLIITAIGGGGGGAGAGVNGDYGSGGGGGAGGCYGIGGYGGGGAGANGASKGGYGGIGGGHGGTGRVYENKASYGGYGGGLKPSYTGFKIISSIRNLTYTIGIGGDGGSSSSGGSRSGNGSSGVVAIREFTTETVYVRTA